MMASERLSGLAVVAARFSLLMSRNLKLDCFEAPDTSRCTECRDGLSKLRREAGLNVWLRPSAKSWNLTELAVTASSWPGASGAVEDGGIARLPESEDAPRTRFKGLLGEVRFRVNGLAVEGRGLADLTDSFTLDLKGVKAVVCGVEEVVAVCCPALGVLKLMPEIWPDMGYRRGEW
jgi:hypothetical protein